MTVTQQASLDPVILADVCANQPSLENAVTGLCEPLEGLGDSALAPGIKNESTKNYYGKWILNKCRGLLSPCPQS